MPICATPGCLKTARIKYHDKACLDKHRNDQRRDNGKRSNTTLSQRKAEDRQARTNTLALASWKRVTTYDV